MPANVNCGVVVPLGAAPRLPPPFIPRVPALRVTPPVKVLAPDNVRVPLPEYARPLVNELPLLTAPVMVTLPVPVKVSVTAALAPLLSTIEPRVSVPPAPFTVVVNPVVPTSVTPVVMEMPPLELTTKVDETLLLKPPVLLKVCRLLLVLVIPAVRLNVFPVIV